MELEIVNKPMYNFVNKTGNYTMTVDLRTLLLYGSNNEIYIYKR